jgi:hypothetical protein
MMDSVAFLSHRFSKREIKRHIPDLVPQLSPAVPIAGASSGAVFAALGALINMGSIAPHTFVITAGAAGVAGGYAAIPIALAAAGYGVYRYLGIEKQTQGTALYMVRRLLTKLRPDWDKVSEGHQEQLQRSFNNMRDQSSVFDGLKPSTSNLFFADQYIDPSTFKSNNPIIETSKKIYHFMSPVVARINDRQDKIARPDASASAAEKNLITSLRYYHHEAERHGVPDAKLPEAFLGNFQRHTNKPEFSKAAQIVADCFNGVRGTVRNAYGERQPPLPEYTNPVNKRKILEQIVEMTRRLASGDEEFVQTFVEVARMATETCHNNTRQILKALWSTVAADQAMKSENGLDGAASLLAFGMRVFRGEALKAATFKVMGDDIDVEVGNAVEIALGKMLGIADPIEGMGYLQMVGKVTQEKLDEIRVEVIKTTRNSDAFTDFLSRWSPLKQKIEATLDFQFRHDWQIKEARDAYDRAEQAY